MTSEEKTSTASSGQGDGVDDQRVQQYVPAALPIFSGACLTSILAPENNSFTLVRLLAALAVIVSHAFEITVAREAPQPLSSLTPYNLGQHAVNAFFVISGLTLAQSLALRPDLARFLAARVLRIFPALIVYGLVFAFVVGPALTSLALGDYFSDVHTYFYPITAPVLFADATPPPGVFTTVPVSGIVNEPLWTIRYEFIAYLCLALLAAVGLFPNPTALLLVAFAVISYFAVIEVVPEITDSFPALGSLARFGFCFMIGVLAYVFRDRIVLSPTLLAAAVALAWLLNDTIVAPPAYLVLIAYLIFILGAGSYGAVGRWTRTNDISYGTYLYGWPIQQTLMVAFPGMTAVANMAGALLLAPLAGLLSWRLVERRALSLKSKISPSVRPTVEQQLSDSSETNA